MAAKMTFKRYELKYRINRAQRDALLKAGKISREKYDAEQVHAKELIREYEKKEQARHGK